MQNLRRLLRIAPEATSFARRGFTAGERAARERLEAVGRAFVAGHAAALDDPDPAAIEGAIGGLPRELRGVGFEGAAMALALLDALTPWRRDRWRALHARCGSQHAHLLHVGVGWALARLHRRLSAPPAHLDPLLGWLAVDGYGFHEGYFHPRAYLRAHARPRRLSGYAARVFDQGLGRCLWFAEGADAALVARAVEGFPASRRADVWSGVGLACAYAGGADADGLALLRAAAGLRAGALGQGAAFAAKARAQGGNPAPHTEEACARWCSLTAAEAARLTDGVLVRTRGAASAERYEAWRRGLQARFAPARTGGAP